MALLQKQSSLNTELPHLKARVSVQERMVTILQTRIEELSQDMTASFRQLADYQIQMEQKTDARFDRIETTLAEHNARFDRIETTLAEHNVRFDRIDTTLAEHNARFDKVDHRFDKIEAILAQILVRLPEKP